jgi:hypothetical protein
VVNDKGEKQAMNRLAGTIGLIGLLVASGAPATAAEHLQWVPAVAHVAGANGTVWRTDVAILNSCDLPATVTLHLEVDGQTLEQAFVIGPGRQQVFTDVVAQLGGGDGSAALLVVSDGPVTVTSRTYNLSAAGTYGQAFDGVAPSAAPEQGIVSLLAGLREDDDFRSNIAFLNSSDVPTTATVELFDGTGHVVEDFSRQIQPGARLQVDRPYRVLYGRDDIIAGWARVSADGAGVWVSGSVVDNATGDPTTVLPQSAPPCPADILDRLAAIDGLEVIEQTTTRPGYRYFELWFDQPADHDLPDGERFTQYMTLLVREQAAPMVFMTKGYNNSQRDRLSELTAMFGANQLAVEHRFFATSRPPSGDWGLLNIEQAAADLHRVVEALKPLFPGPWISTGHSKGGMTAVYHRRFWPDDVDGSVAYVAPLSYGHDDPRYVDFLESVSDSACRSRLVALQRQALSRRDQLLTIFDAEVTNASYDRIGGREAAFETVVIELPFVFWQYWGAGFCSGLPSPTAVSDHDLFDLLDLYVGFYFPEDSIFDFYDPYFYQAHHQLGYPAVPMDGIADLLEVFPPSLEEGVVPIGTAPVFEPEAMLDVASWVATEGERLLFVYGENDPWSAGAFELGEAADSYVFTVPSGTHGSLIEDLSVADRGQAETVLERWFGVTPARVAPSTVIPDGDLLRRPPGLLH